MERSAQSHEGVYEFYFDRIKSSRNYGLVAGDGILNLVRRCAFWDSFLTDYEFNIIIIQCDEMHKKLMEDNFNAGWEDK